MPGNKPGDSANIQREKAMTWMNGCPERSSRLPDVRGAPLHALVIGLLAATLGGGCGGGGNEGPKAAGVDAAVVVTVQPAERRAVPRAIEAVGTLRGFEEVAISAKVGGRVWRILKDIGDRVEPRELLLEIDPTDYELAERQVERALQVELAKLGLEALPTGSFDIHELPTVMQARARLDNARHHLETARNLFSKKAVAPDELTDRELAERIAQAGFAEQELVAKAGLATLRMRQEDLSIARQQLADTKIRVPVPSQILPDPQAPIQYAIAARRVSEGTFVPPGTELYHLVIDDWLKLRVTVPERYTADVKPEQAVEVFAAAYDRPFSGTVRRINPAVDPLTRTFEVWILVQNTDRLLKPGSFAKAAIQTRVDPAAMTVPLEAVVRFAGVTKIFIVEGDKVRERHVETGQQGDTWIEVTGAEIPEGAMVVTSGQTALADGSTIEIRAPAAAAEAGGGASAGGGR